LIICTKEKEMSSTLHRISAFSLVVLFSVFSHLASATLITDRNQLNSILGGFSVTEDFETLVIAPGTSVESVGPELNSATAGGNLVIDGVNFISIAPDLPAIIWNGVGYLGQGSQNILSSGSLLIDFSINVNTVGMDLGVFQGLADSASIKVFGSDDTSLLTEFIGVDLGTQGAVDKFFGFYQLGDIGAIEISGINGWSPLLDNLTFNVGGPATGGPNGGGANPIPEPATALMFLIGLLGLIKRRI
jgi:hypothetical protein